MKLGELSAFTFSSRALALAAISVFLTKFGFRARARRKSSSGSASFVVDSSCAPTELSFLSSADTGGALSSFDPKPISTSRSSSNTFGTFIVPTAREVLCLSKRFEGELLTGFESVLLLELVEFFGEFGVFCFL